MRIEIKTKDCDESSTWKKAHRLGLLKEHYGDEGWTKRRSRRQRGSDRSDLHQRHMLEDGRQPAIKVINRFFHKEAAARGILSAKVLSS